MKGAEIINNGSIVIRNGRITDIGPSSIVDTPQDAIVRDMSGMTIMPGMIDMHAHIKPPKNVVVNHWWEFISYIAHGVMTIRDPSIDSDLPVWRSEEHTSELQSLMRISYAVFCLKTQQRPNMTTETAITLIFPNHLDTYIPANTKN